jgi:virginiamycin B lyase
VLRESVLAFAAATIFSSVGPAQARPQRGQPVQLPEGTGKEMVQNSCSQCHGLNLVANAGYTEKEWRGVFSSMVALPTDQSAAIAAYLAKNFPEKPKLPAVVIPGRVDVSIREWVVPSLGSRPHDPLATADGAIWWTGQWANVLGRLDPKTGEMKEFPLKTPKSGPHGLTADKHGNIWYTGNSAALIGKLDPKTAEITEYRMPDSAARDPHTPIFDQKGMLWFTLQGSNMVGRLNPATGEIKLATAPTRRSLPYGIVVDSKGTPWFVQFGVNKLASIDPNSMEITEYTLPNPETRPRRLAITSDDVLWYADYSRGYLGRFDPKTGAVREWPSPGGRQSHPYGITTAKGIIWYSESAVSPNTLVRFDPKTEKFQTWVIPSGGGVVRNMMATPEGNLVMACSGRNRVALVLVNEGRVSVLPSRMRLIDWHADVPR